MSEIEKLRADNQLLRQQVDSLYAKIGRLTDLIATIQTDRGVGIAGSGIKGTVRNPGDPEHVPA